MIDLPTLNHDIQSQMTTIKNYVWLSGRFIESENYDTLKRYYQKIHDAVDGLSDYISVMSMMSVHELQAVNLVSVVDDAINYFDFPVVHRSENIPCDTTVLANTVLITVFNNLFQNSIRYGTHIDVFYECHKNDIIVAVRDDGSGIPENIQHRVFNRGFSTFDSSGLGLYIVKRVVEMFHGEVWFESSQSTGTTFFIRLRKFNKEKNDDTE